MYKKTPSPFPLLYWNASLQWLFFTCQAHIKFTKMQSWEINIITKNKSWDLPKILPRLLPGYQNLGSQKLATNPARTSAKILNTCTLQLSDLPGQRRWKDLEMYLWSCFWHKEEEHQGTLTSMTYQKIDQSHNIDPCIDNTFHFLDWWLR